MLLTERARAAASFESTKKKEIMSYLLGGSDRRVSAGVGFVLVPAKLVVQTVPCHRANGLTPCTAPRESCTQQAALFPGRVRGSRQKVDMHVGPRGKMTLK